MDSYNSINTGTASMRPQQSRMVRDEQAYSAIPETLGSSPTKRGPIGRQPSDLIQAELESNPVVNCHSFKPAIDEFLKNGPSADVEKVKNLAAELATMNSQVDAAHLSTEIDASLCGGPNEPRHLERRGMSSGDLGFSLNSFSSLVDFGDLGGAGASGDVKPGDAARALSWQKSVSDLVPNEKNPERFHKEYRVYENNDQKRLTSKDWVIDYSMSSTTLAPNHDGIAPDLTNNVVTSVKMNDIDNPEDNTFHQPVARPQYLSDNQRQMSVEINTASVGIDPEGRLGSYELVKTLLKMEPSPRHSIDDMEPSPIAGYYAMQQGAQHHHQPHAAINPATAANYLNGAPNANFNNFGHFEEPAPRPHSHQRERSQQFLAQQQQQQQYGGYGQQSLNHQHMRDPHNNMQHIPTTFVVPPKSGIATSKETGVISPYEIKDGDVLLERGGKGNHHKGSRFYRRLINERRGSYQDLPDSARAEKMAISLSVVMSLKNNGARFIHKKKGQYIVMSDREARNKISQALREKKERVMLDA